MPKVLTAPLAKIKVVGADGLAVEIGRMRDIRVNETFRRGRVVGLGELTPSELPILEWSGALTCSQYLIKSNTGFFNAVDRSMNNVTQFVRSLLFDEGIRVELIMLRKTTTGYDELPIASIARAVLTTEGMSVTEMQIAGHDATFEYMSPILYG